MPDHPSAPALPTASQLPIGLAGHLYLIGLPGSGKTTLGRQLAAHYGREFVDLDEVVVREAGRSIPEIFAVESELGFRQREAAALTRVAARPKLLVVATGGGTPCFHHNLQLLRCTGFVLWLAVPVPELARRLAAAGQAAARPLLAATAAPATESPETALNSHLTRTLAARQQFYAHAHLQHPGGGPAEVVAALAAAGFRP